MGLSLKLRMYILLSIDEKHAINADLQNVALQTFDLSPTGVIWNTEITCTLFVVICQAVTSEPLRSPNQTPNLVHWMYKNVTT